MRYRPRRVPTDYSVTLDVDGGIVRAQVLDMTSEGLRLSPGISAQPGDEAALVVRGTRYRGRVIWKGDDEFGLAMTRPLPPDVRGLLKRSHIGSRRTTRHLID